MKSIKKLKNMDSQIKRLYNWILGRSNKDKPLDKDYVDEFRLKIIQLKSGLFKFYPEYKSGIMSGWAQLIMLNNKGIGTIFLSDHDLIESVLAYCDTEKEAIEIIDMYKNQLIKQRETEFLNQQIKEI